MEQNINQQLMAIQAELKAPKSQYNSFGKYKYRSCEDILEAAKPLLKELGCVLLLSDEVKEVGNAYTFNTQENDSKSGKSSASAYNGTRVYVVATATIINSAGEKLSVQGMAREEVAKKGMDAAQITGAASSYARKYALNGLFCIDDTKDADATNTHGQEAKPKTKKEQMYEDTVQDALDEIKQCNTVEDLTNTYKHYPMLISEKRFIDALSARKKEIKS